MPITPNQLLDAIGKAKSGEDLSTQIQATPDEVDKAFAGLHDFFAPHPSGGPTPPHGAANAVTASRPEVKPSASLTTSEKAVAGRLTAGFEEHVRAGQLHFEHVQHGMSLPFAMEKEIEKEGPSEKLHPPLKVVTAVAAPDAGPCYWHWWFRTYWWGFRLSLNSCAVNMVTKGAGAVSGALTAFGLPAVAAVALAAVAAILKGFDNGIGVRIYVTWVGVSWITSKPA